MGARGFPGQGGVWDAGTEEKSAAESHKAQERKHGKLQLTTSVPFLSYEEK